MALDYWWQGRRTDCVRDGAALYLLGEHVPLGGPGDRVMWGNQLVGVLTRHSPRLWGCHIPRGISGTAPVRVLRHERPLHLVGPPLTVDPELPAPAGQIERYLTVGSRAQTLCFARWGAHLLLQFDRLLRVDRPMTVTFQGCPLPVLWRPDAFTAAVAIPEGIPVGVASVAAAGEDGAVLWGPPLAVEGWGRPVERRAAPADD